MRGAEKLRKLNLKARFIFFEVPVDVLKKRLKERNEKEIEKRLSLYQEEMEYKKYFDVSVDTSGTEGDIQENVKKVLSIMDST